MIQYLRDSVAEEKTVKRANQFLSSLAFILDSRVDLTRTIIRDCHVDDGRENQCLIPPIERVHTLTEAEPGYNRASTRHDGKVSMPRQTA
jgi:hypothetical protein